MAFSDGQLYFAIGFFILFILVMIAAYRSDLKKLSLYRKDGLIVLGFIILVFAIFYGTIKLLNT